MIGWPNVRMVDGNLPRCLVSEESRDRPGAAPAYTAAVKRLLAPVVAVIVLALTGCAGVGTTHTAAQWNAPASPDANDDAVALPSPDPVSMSPSASPSPSKSPSKSPSAKPSPTRKPSSSKAPSAGNVRTVYGVTFTIASGGTRVIGPSAGKLERYEVAVQTGLSETPSSVAATVDSILDNQTRGWARSGKWRFQRVSSGPYDFVVELATAANTDLICGKYGIKTEGVVNCRGQANVVINLNRWEQGTNGTTSGATKYDPATYRILAVNHEVGHALGFNHMACPSSGGPAPVMMTQYYGLNGCTPNVWPYDADGTFIQGPAA